MRQSSTTTEILDWEKICQSKGKSILQYVHLNCCLVLQGSETKDSGVISDRVFIFINDNDNFEYGIETNKMVSIT